MPNYTILAVSSYLAGENMNFISANMNTKRTIELLAPAKNLETGIAAIKHGADAVYIGAPKFGARYGAGNELKDIEQLVLFAHKYWAKVFVTLNTIIYEEELEEVRTLIHQLHAIGVDALIIQDMGITVLDIPPIALHASTQTHNYDVAKVQFLEQTGFSRVILAREVSINRISEIKQQTNVELEAFVHGALCVSFSGQCYMSQATSGRSANRGECAQNCRLPYALIDRNEEVIVKDKHLLSLKDLNLSSHLFEMMQAGVSSFKIEGRLKDIQYVKNITAYYSNLLDEFCNSDSNFKRASSGRIYLSFTPDPEKTFNRGFTEYFIEGERNVVGSVDSPKSKGKFIGRVKSVGEGYIVVDSRFPIIPGDGLCFYDKSDALNGFYVNEVNGNKIVTELYDEVKIGEKIFRNHDHEFMKELSRDSAARKIPINITLTSNPKEIRCEISDEDSISSVYTIENTFELAKDVAKAQSTLATQFTKTGDTIFETEELNVDNSYDRFIPISVINEFRRKALENHEEQRNVCRPIEARAEANASAKYYETSLDYLGNVTNSKAREFYEQHGVESIQPGLEVLEEPVEGALVMRTKYCVKKQLNSCPFEKNEHPIDFQEPLFLDDGVNRYRLHFRCAACEMEIRTID